MFSVQRYSTLQPLCNSTSKASSTWHSLHGVTALENTWACMLQQWEVSESAEDTDYSWPGLGAVQQRYSVCLIKALELIKVGFIFLVVQNTAMHH